MFTARARSARCRYRVPRRPIPFPRVAELRRAAGSAQQYYAATLRVGAIGTQANLNYRFEGGDGNDSYNANIAGEAMPVTGAGTNRDSTLVGQFGLSTVDLTFTGGGGNDSAQVNLAGNLAASSDTSVNLFGSRGNDQFFTGYTGALNGRLDVVLDGGSGRDQLTTDVKLKAGTL